jgi:hypothetical protein
MGNDKETSELLSPALVCIVSNNSFRQQIYHYFLFKNKFSSKIYLLPSKMIIFAA